MSATQALAWAEVEDALAAWAYKSAGIDPKRVRVPAPRAFGEARGPAPKVLISLVSLLPISQVGEHKLSLVMQQRYTVLAGAGEVGVDFYPGYSFTPQRISVVAGAGDAPSATAVALLAELQSDLPAPFTAELGSATVELELGNVEGGRVPRGSEVTLDSDPAFPWVLEHDVYLPGTGTFTYSQPGGSAPAGSTWTIKTPAAGWNLVKPNAADSLDPESVIVKGTSAAPLFSSGAVRNPDLTTVADIVSRRAIFSMVHCFVVWRVEYRSDGVSGGGLASAAAAQALVFKRALLHAPMERLGFVPKGIANFAPDVPLERDESLATLDVRFQGIMTGARTATPMRRSKVVGTARIL